LLANHFLSELNAQAMTQKRLSAHARMTLKQHSWPGNVRELKNLIERLLIMSEGESIGLREVEAALPAGAEEEPVSEIRAARDRAERDAILATLRQCSWNVTEAAKRLGMDRGYLHRKIKRYGLVRDAQT
jgi:two-component system nitrogen regulation response regulator NtrX